MECTNVTECQHAVIDDRTCDDCGMIVESLKMVRGWGSKNHSISKLQKNQSMSIYIQLGYQYSDIKNAFDIIERISKIKKNNFKGNRKKGIMFCHLVKVLKTDPDVIRKTLSLTRKQCQPSIDLYETYAENISWNWRELLKSKLKTLGIEELEDQIRRKIEAENLSNKCVLCSMISVIVKTCETNNITFINPVNVSDVIMCECKKSQKKNSIYKNENVDENVE